MTKFYRIIISLLAIYLVVQVSSVRVAAQEASWISYPSANITQYGVYHFRKSFDLEIIPEKLIVHISADNRYNLFVNGKRVGYGPAKGDLKTYKYDIIDIAPFLKTGKNILAALVYNGGKDKPMAFISVQTAFMLKTEDPRLNWLNTDSSWKVLKNKAYRVISYKEMIFTDPWFKGYYACGGGDELFADKYPWDWELPEFDDSSWVAAEKLVFDGDPPWNLVPRNISFMDNHIEQPARIRRVSGVDIPIGSWDGKSKLSIPPHTKATILIDFDILTMGYPELTVSGGKNGRVKIKYAEALYEKVDLKAHRDSVNEKTMYGVWDIFHPDGKNGITFRPLWKRAFRYIQLVIETKTEPLDIISFENEYSGYPYPKMSTFTSSDEQLNEIHEMCLQTLRMCSGETYYDTPFYEQLSYGGDNRPIAAISTYNSTDDRLLREVMRLYPQSENNETGLFKSAYPSNFDFDMGSWSLAWIQSLYDYFLIRGDSSYVSQFVENIERVLGFYERHLDKKTGLIGTVRNGNFMDWSITKGSLPRADEKNEMKQSVMLTLNYAHTLDCTVSLYKELGLSEKSQKWIRSSRAIKDAVNESCYNEQEQLFSDYPDQQIFSQHTNILAILCGLVPHSDQVQLLHRILSYDKFDEIASSYFSFFLFKAMKKTGQQNLFLENLDSWHNFIDRGHTTCGETGFASHDRSDCHAWSAHPAYYLLSIVCGINPADIGFSKVKITPHFGKLDWVKSSMPHPKGDIVFDVKRLEGNGIKGFVELPPGLTGTFEWQGRNIALKANQKNKILFKN